MSKESRSDFIEGYAANSGMSIGSILDKAVALPCDCGQEGCEGWAMVALNKSAVQAHLDLYWSESGARSEGKS